MISDTHEKLDEIINLDSIIFDCDGVLIDIRNSYDKTIKETVRYVVNKITNVDINNFVTSTLISSFKRSGGFNNEVDLSYSIIISIIAAIRLKIHYRKFILDVVENLDVNGISSVENYLRSIIHIDDMISELHYPYKNNIICNIFDELFYGSKLYSIILKKTPIFCCDGFIKNDKILLTKSLLDILQRKFKRKIAIVTGRGLVSARYSLRNLLNYFDIQNSVFLDDLDRSFAKPNPNTLINSILGLKSSSCLYVGDSMEDLIMVHRANKLGFRVIFCGIFGTDDNKDDKINLFKKKNAHIILESINLLPNVLNLDDEIKHNDQNGEISYL